jgi:ubiquinone biosynthesis protein UbiJ
MSSLFDRAAVAAINHLLAAESWATGRLHAFAGRRVAVEGGPMMLHLCIDEHGLFRVPEAAGEADVTITVPADAPWRLLTDRSSLFQTVRLTGSVDLAETLGFVFRNLGWDVEGDLAACVGDIPARRLVMAGRRFAAWQAGAARNLAGNVAEYASEEAGLLVPRRDLDEMRSQLAALGEDLAALERRLQHLR